jgi:hypothetical protein
LLFAAAGRFGLGFWVGLSSGLGAKYSVLREIAYRDTRAPSGLIEKRKKIRKGAQTPAAFKAMAVRTARRTPNPRDRLFAPSAIPANPLALWQEGIPLAVEGIQQVV